MSMITKVIYLHALTPVHSGTGQAVAVIDLPIAREKTTNWPIIPGSSVKGVFRDSVDQNVADTICGTQDKMGAVAFSDQLTLFFPVRSYFGTFAYLTCPWALERFRRDLKAFSVPEPYGATPEVKSNGILVTEPGVLNQNGTVYLEDIDLQAQSSTEFSEIAQKLAEWLFTDANEKCAFQKRAALVPNDVFTFFCETATVVTAKVSLNAESKTVVKGGLWYEEAVPAEAIFYAPCLVDKGVPAAADALKALDGKTLQFGGKSTTGRGMCRVRVAG